MPKVTFIYAENGRKETVDAQKGETLLETAHRCGVELDGVCGGAMACLACHVIVSEEWWGKVAAPSGEENEALDSVMDSETRSRLACQIVMSDELDGLVVTLPKRCCGGCW